MRSVGAECLAREGVPKLSLLLLNNDSVSCRRCRNVRQERSWPESSLTHAFVHEPVRDDPPLPLRSLGPRCGHFIVDIFPQESQGLKGSGDNPKPVFVSFVVLNPLRQ